MYTLRLTNKDETDVYDFDWNSISIRETLNLPVDGSAQISFPSANKLATVLQTTVRQIFLQGLLYWKLYYDNTLLYEGIVTNLQITGADVGATNITITFTDYLGALASRTTDRFVFYNNVDSSDIAWGEIAQTQELNSTLSDLGITRGLNPTTVNRQRTARYRKVLDLLLSMSNEKVYNGYDMDIDTDREFNIYYPKKGSIRDDIQFSSFNTISWQTQTPLSTKVYNRVRVLGEGTGDTMVSTTVEDLTVDAITWGIWDAVVSEKSVSKITELIDRGDRFLQLNRVPTDTINIRTTDRAYPLADYGCGDTVTVIIEDLGIRKALRIRSRTIQITPEINAVIDITFEKENAVIVDDEPVS